MILRVPIDLRSGRELKMKITIIASIMLACMPTMLNAQTACPQGVTPGSQQCLPTGQGTAPAPSPARQPRWKLTWGAFASDDAVAVIGTSSGEHSSRSARSAAMRKCSKMGGKNCEVTLVYQNQCAVIADPIDRDTQPRFGSDVSGPTIEEASKLALDSCHKRNGGRRCEIIYSNCTRPVLVN